MHASVPTDSLARKCTCVCPYACTCVRTCAHVQTPFLTPRCPPERAPRDQGRALPAPHGSQHLVSAQPGPGANWGFGGRGFPTNPPDARLGGGPPSAWPPRHGARPEPPTVGWGRSHAPPASATRPGLFWGACLGPGLHPLRTAWTWGTEPGVCVCGGVPRSTGQAPGGGGCVPRGPGRAHPTGPDPHTTDNPHGAEILVPAIPGGRRQFLTCTVLLYQETLPCIIRLQMESTF